MGFEGERRGSSHGVSSLYKCTGTCTCVREEGGEPSRPLAHSAGPLTYWLGLGPGFFGGWTLRKKKNKIYREEMAQCIRECV